MWVDEATIAYWPLDEGYTTPAVTTDGHWKCNDTTGLPTVVNDEGADGTAVGGVTSDTGKINTALHFDGSTGHVDTNTVLSNADEGTLCCWFKIDAGGSTAGNTIMGLMAASDGRCYMGLNDSGKFGVGIGDHSYNTLFSDVDGVADTWYHLAMTFDGHKSRLYVNAAQIGEWTQKGRPSTSLDIFIADINLNGSAGGARLDGLIDDARYFPTALSPADISWIYNDGSGREDALTTGKKYDFLVRDVGFNRLNGFRHGTEPIDIADEHFDKSCLFTRANESAIVIPYTSLLTPSYVTAEAWFRSGALEAGDQRIVDNFVSEDSGWMLWIRDPKLLSWYLRWGATIHELQFDLTTIDTTKQHYLAGTYDGTTSRLYVDGQEVASVDYTNTLAYGANSDVHIGRGSYGSGNALGGELAEIRVSNRARDPWEIKSVWRGYQEIDPALGFTVDDTDVKVCMNFDQDVGGVDGVIDESAATHHGTIGKWVDDAKYHWKMNDNAASAVVVDDKGNQNGTATANTNTMSVAGKVNTALSFPNTTDNIDVTGVTIHDGDKTVCAWFKSSDSSWGQFAFDFATNRILFGWTSEIDGQMGVWASSGGWRNFGSPPADGAWHHVAWVFSGGNVSCYVDASQYGSTQTFPAAAPTGTCKIASRYATYSGDWYDYNGDLDDFRVYERALTQAEIQTLATGTEDELSNIQVAGDGLIAHYLMNDNAANTTVVDETGNHDGVLTGGGNTEDVSIVGKIGGALALVSNPRRIYCGNDAAFDDIKAFSFWVRSLAGKSFTGSICRYSSNSDRWIINCYYDNEPMPSLGVPGQTTLIADTINIRNDGIWHHIVCTYDGHRTVMYVDAIKQTTELSYNPMSYAAGGELMIGAYRYNSGYESSVGGEDDVRFYSRHLDYADVIRLYADGRGRTDNPLGELPRIFSPVNGEGYVFDGSDRAVLIPSHADFNNANMDMTVESWIYVKHKDEAMSVCGKQGSSPNIPVPTLQLDPTNGPRAFIQDSASNSIDVYDSNLDYEIDRWYHLAAVLTAGEKRLTLFLNGAAVVSAVNASIDLTDCANSAPLHIGGSSSNPLHGGVAAFRFTQRARTAKEIFDHVKAANIREV